MKVTGFSFIRNGTIYDYPFIEAIQSVLPLCDEFVVAVGNSKDDTLERVKALGAKIKIIETTWDESLRKGGAVLADETNKAYQAISADTDWCFYIQGDEVLSEEYLDAVKSAMLLHKNNPEVEGLLFDYLHFYGSYDYIGSAPRWYRREIRVVRKRDDIFSYRDAQGFRKKPNDKLTVKQVGACIYHYGYVRDPKAMQRKSEEVGVYWGHEAQAVSGKDFDYSGIDALTLFKGKHPIVMQERLARINWKFDHDISKTNYSFKQGLKKWIEKLTGYRIGEYKNYILRK